jgi:tubulin beta
VSFDESATGRFTARSILVDTDPASLDLIRASPLAKLFRPDW